MGVGSIILTTATQNLTELGGLRTRMPATVGAFLIGSLGMVALLPLGSFWSMVSLYEVFKLSQGWLAGILLVVSGLTALNLTRVFGLLFTGPPKLKTRRAPEVQWPMAVPMVVLTVVTALLPLMLWQWGLLPSWTPRIQEAAIALVLASGVGMVVGATYYVNPKAPKSFRLRWGGIQDLLAYDFYVNNLYQICVVYPFRWGARLVEWIDRFIVDGLVNMVSLMLILGAEGLKYTISGRMQAYILTIMVGLALVTMLLWQLSWFGAVVG